MRIPRTLKNLFFNNFYPQHKNYQLIGLRIFQCGVLFLAAAPSISFVLLLSSSILSSFNRHKNFFNDKFNYPLILVAILMLMNCIFITLINKDIDSFQKTTIWVGLSNWLPFFWCFWGFQPFLKNQNLRIKTGKLLIIGSLPVLLSGFCQYFLKIYGPYNFFNNLIIWYQRPLDSAHGVTGLFNNQNYAGAWLCIIFPLCIVFLVRKNKDKVKTLLIFLLCLSFVYMIFLTTSRGAILSIFISIFLFSRSIKNKLLASFSLLSIPLILNLIPILGQNFQSIIYKYLPLELIKKTSLINISNLNIFPRIEIWQKSLELIKSNLIIGYGAGSFESLYNGSNGKFGDIQHSHNIFLELAINHGLPSSLIILFMMLFIIFNSWKKIITNYKNYSFFLYPNTETFDKAWIISFIAFLLIHFFDITYFDGRISTIGWILLSGMIPMIRGKVLE